MTKNQYLQTRRLIRDNGRYALQWLDAESRLQWDNLLFNIQDSTDWLKERADIVNSCTRKGIEYNFRHLAKY